MTNCKWVTRLGLSHRVWKIALCLTVLSDLDVELAVSWLAQRRRRLKRQSGIRKNASLLRIRQHLTSTVVQHDLADMCSVSTLIAPHSESMCYGMQPKLRMKTLCGNRFASTMTGKECLCHPGRSQIFGLLGTQMATSVYPCRRGKPIGKIGGSRLLSGLTDSDSVLELD